ncbi:MAG: STAS domain-containing protein [Cyanobacteria bacterium P01_G01_bin.4]
MIAILKRAGRQSPEGYVHVLDGLNSDFLFFCGRTLQIDPAAPIFKRLESADLLNSAQIAAIQTQWQQRGGAIADIVLQETGLDFATLIFFSNTRWLSHLSFQKRIGEYLLEAHLVSERELSRTLLERRDVGHPLPLGVALSERGILKQSTADFFARTLVHRSKAICLRQSVDAGNRDDLVLVRHVEFADSAAGYLLSIVPLWGRLERLSSTQLRKDLFEIATRYSPNIILDMSMVSSLNLATLRALIATANMCREWRGKLSVCGLNERVHAFLSCQLHSLGLESFASREAAIECFSLY